MALEKAGYRDNLERVLLTFPGKELLTVSDVSKFTGLNRRTVKKIFEFKNNYISAASLARQMAS